MSDIDEGDREGDHAHDGFKYYRTHKYGLIRSGRPAKCLRCKCRRRSTRGRDGKMRRIVIRSVNERIGRWQYRPADSKHWQYTHPVCKERL